MTWPHLGIGVDLLVKEATELEIARRDDAHANDLRRFCGSRVGQFLVGNSRHIDLNVDAVHQGPGDFRHVPLDLRWRAEALPAKVVRKAARAGVTRSNKDKCRWKRERHLSAGDGH